MWIGAKETTDTEDCSILNVIAMKLSEQEFSSPFLVNCFFLGKWRRIWATLSQNLLFSSFESEPWHFLPFRCGCLHAQERYFSERIFRSTPVHYMPSASFHCACEYVRGMFKEVDQDCIYFFYLRIWKEKNSNILLWSLPFWLAGGHMDYRSVVRSAQHLEGVKASIHALDEKETVCNVQQDLAYMASRIFSWRQRACLSNSHWRASRNLKKTVEDYS